MSAVKGVDEVKHALQQLPAKIAEKIAKKALRQAANMVAKQVRANAPVKTGRLKKAIKVKASRYDQLKKNGKIGVIIRVKPGRDRKDTTGAWYAGFVEYGYNHGSKVAGGYEALSLGLITRKELSEKKAYYASKRRFGRTARKVRIRYGGNRVEGQHFAQKAFESLKNAASDMVIRNGTAAAEQAIRELKLK